MRWSALQEKITKFDLPFDIKEAYLMGHSFWWAFSYDGSVT